MRLRAKAWWALCVALALLQIAAEEMMDWAVGNYHGAEMRARGFE